MIRERISSVKVKIFAESISRESKFVSEVSDFRFKIGFGFGFFDHAQDWIVACDINFNYSGVQIAFKIIGDYVVNYSGRCISYSSGFGY